GSGGHESFTSQILDFLYNKTMDDSEKQEHRITIGDVPQMTEFSDRLPPYEIIFNQPFTFTRNTSLPFFVDEISETKEISLVYDLHDIYTNMLLMKVK